MKKCSKFLLALTLSFGFMAQSYAASSDQGSRPQGGPPAFSSIDSDGDGEISFAEFSAKEIPHGDHQTVFDDIDSNGDGIITESEFSSHKPPRPQN
ncbi:EF-hand domain-containing protein [Psychromonas sp. SP041]|uniref:EF-hand domain-containing protein n=1 Tax=Psychromonas sp. SP041 TaxID=1365007 RepID=UPI0004178EF5|nr:EF-hand domain-containing protein [Psychromonas sp. SP041]